MVERITSNIFRKAIFLEIEIENQIDRFSARLREMYNSTFLKIRLQSKRRELPAACGPNEEVIGVVNWRNWHLMREPLETGSS
jgi:hypothetical protein